MRTGPIVEKLERLFGLGQSPLITRRLYARIEREVNVYGDPVRAIVNELCQTAMGKRNPSVWFRGSVGPRLQEYGYFKAGPLPTKETVAAKQRQVEDLAAKLGLEFDGAAT